MLRTCLVVLGVGLLLHPAAGGQSDSSEQADVVLVGVIATENPSDSVALLRRAGSARSRAVRIGQEFEGLVLVEVSTRSARLISNGGEILLFLSGRSSAGIARQSEQPVLEPDEAWIRRSFPRQTTRERFEKEMPVILTETDLAPRVEEGEVRGLGVVRLPDGTLLSETGLLPGDVLVSINGEPLRSVGSLWELLSRFVAEGEIRVVVRRKGELLKLAYAITN
jgi:type II secretion system protein C